MKFRRRLILCSVLVISAGRADEPITTTQAPPRPIHDNVFGLKMVNNAMVMTAHIVPGSMYIKGYWVWRDGRYTWVQGYWEKPPRPGAVWVAPRWEHQGSIYRFHEGYWK